MGLYALVYTPGLAWIPKKPVTQQPLQEHMRYMSQLYAEGKLFIGGPLNPESLDVNLPGGLIVIDVESLDAALAVMHHDPAIQAQIVKGACYPWSPLLNKGSEPFNHLAPPTQ